METCKKKLEKFFLKINIQVQLNDKSEYERTMIAIP